MEGQEEKEDRGRLSHYSEATKLWWNPTEQYFITYLAISTILNHQEENTQRGVGEIGEKYSPINQKTMEGQEEKEDRGRLSHYSEATKLWWNPTEQYFITYLAISTILNHQEENTQRGVGEIGESTGRRVGEHKCWNVDNYSMNKYKTSNPEIFNNNKVETKI
jgi:hypothetical protein